MLPRSRIGKNSLVSNAILGWDSTVGDWSHIEGVVEKKIDPNNKFSINTASSDHANYFTTDGSLKKLVTILGAGLLPVPAWFLLMGEISCRDE